MLQFFHRLAHYRKSLAVVVLTVVLPYVLGWFRDTLFTEGAGRTWEWIGGPAILANVLSWMSAHPLRSAGLGIAAWVGVAALLSESHVRRTLHGSGTQDQTAWRDRQLRFEKLAGTIYVLWTYYPESGRVGWQLCPTPDTNTSQRDIQAFDAEAAEAGMAIKAMREPPVKFSIKDVPLRDVWLSTIAALVDPDSHTKFSGHNSEGRHLGGCIENIMDASRVACARLAVGDTAKSKGHKKGHRESGAPELPAVSD